MIEIKEDSKKDTPKKLDDEEVEEDEEEEELKEEVKKMKDELKQLKEQLKSKTEELEDEKAKEMLKINRGVKRTRQPEELAKKTGSTREYEFGSNGAIWSWD